MIKDFQDVLYTPLDTPPLPDYDGKELYDWIQNTYEEIRQTDFSIIVRELGLTGEKGVTQYPWDLSYIYFNSADQGTGWVLDFQERFPQITEWIFDAFGISEDDVGGILLLPLRPDSCGTGFWHRDTDFSGLRVYLEFENYQKDKLYIKRSKKPYPYNSSDLPIIPNEEELKIYFQDERLECKVISNRCCFYLNNYRSIHQIWTEEPGKIRIAALICPRIKKLDNNVHKNYQKSGEKLLLKSADLIKRSAEKYSEQAILWKPE